MPFLVEMEPLLCVCTRCLAPLLLWGAIPRQSNALWSDSMLIRRLVERFHAHSQRFAHALVSDGFARNAWMGLGGRPRLRARS
jgi:hypothetical protein